MPLGIPAGQLTLHVFSKTRRLPIATTNNIGVVLNNPFGLFFAKYAWIGCISPAAQGVPNTSQRGTKLEVAYKWADGLHNPYHLGVPNAPKRGTNSEVAHKWADWLHSPCHLRGSPTLHSRGQTHRAHKWADGLHNPYRLTESSML